MEDWSSKRSLQVAIRARGGKACQRRGNKIEVVNRSLIS